MAVKLRDFYITFRPERPYYFIIRAGCLKLAEKAFEEIYEERSDMVLQENKPDAEDYPDGCKHKITIQE